jgi:phosphatidylserine/phosphatidylglycerophosphate/cardiolipin synthase-like enzyme
MPRMGVLAPPIGLPNRVDAAVGNGLERLIVRHHRRRLRRIGRLDALDTPSGGWAVGDPPPRLGSAVEILVDGAEALPRIAEEIEGTRSQVWLAGWFFSPDFRLRADDGTTLRELLAEAAERVDVRVLAWAGSPLPLFHPDRRELRAMRDELVRGTRISCALDARERPLHCHHEKLVLVDDRVAFVGGIDLTSYSAPASIRVGTALAGTTRQAVSAGRWLRTSPPTSDCAGTR